MKLSEMHKQQKAREQAEWDALSDEEKARRIQCAKNAMDEWNRHHDSEASCAYMKLRHKYKLRTKYGLRTVRSIIDAVDSGKLVIDDTDFPYGSYEAFKSSVDTIDYDNDDCGQAPKHPWCYMSIREYLQWIESGHPGYSINFNPQARGYSSYEAWKAAVLSGDLDD